VYYLLNPAVDFSHCTAKPGADEILQSAFAIIIIVWIQYYAVQTKHYYIDVENITSK